MKTTTRARHPSGMSKTEVLMIIFSMIIVVCALVVAAAWWKRGVDRSATIMHIRNCQQAMRGHQGMYNLYYGEPFTRKDIERYLKFPEDIHTLQGPIRFTAGTKVCPMSADPAVNDDHLWLKVDAPGTEGYVGRYGFESIEDSTGW